jgi:hypothetical protein
MRVVVHSASIQDRDGTGGCSTRSAAACCLTGSPPHSADRRLRKSAFRQHCIGRLSHGVATVVSGKATMGSSR